VNCRTVPHSVVAKGSHRDDLRSRRVRGSSVVLRQSLPTRPGGHFRERRRLVRRDLSEFAERRLNPPTPTVLHQPAQGCAAGATLGESTKSSTPSGLCHVRAGELSHRVHPNAEWTQPFQGWPVGVPNPG